MQLFNLFLILWSLLALIVFLTLFFKTAPYGRHIQDGWGLKIPSRIGWIVMESPALLLLILFCVLSTSNNIVQYILLGFWYLHYFHRSFIWPFRARISGKSMPLLIALLAIAFNLINATIQGSWIFLYSDYSPEWLLSKTFLIGAFIFLVGMFINIYSDNVLLKLRKDQNGYTMPKGFLYEKVSCPNYLGEIIEWLGWAIMTWSFAGLVFFLWTVANLLPRAIANHKWYKEEFANYPPQRKAIIPYLF